MEISDSEKVHSDKSIVLGSSSDDNAVEVHHVPDDSAKDSTSTGTMGTDKDDADEYEHDDSGDYHDNYEDEDNDFGTQKK